MGGPYRDIDKEVNDLMKATDTRQNSDMRNTVNNATSQRMKSAGTGNAFAVLSDDGRSYSAVHESDKESLTNRSAVPKFVSAEVADQMRNKPDFDAKALDAGIRDRYTDKKALNKAGRSGEISNDEWREGTKAFNKENKEARIANRASKDRLKTAKEEKKRVAKANKPSKAEKKSMKLDNKIKKSNEKFYKKTGIDLNQA
tara:strand:+ start:267 stop:866 length:600 start_codon:yes stop_codon:yes gene_type:complete